MGLSGNWKNSVAVEASVTNNLGTGWNPIHAKRSGDGRDIAPNRGSSLTDVVPQDYTLDPHLDDPAGSDSQGAYVHDDDTTWGYSPDDGTADRPGWDITTEQFRDNSQIPSPAWPEWGPYSNGMPGGTIIRDENRGATNTKRTKVRPTETVTEGWENKQHEDRPEDPTLPDDSQRIMQTSMMQRDQARAGSQAAAGRANDARASIGSRMVGMRLKLFSGGERHYDMTPRSAEERIRPWWSRTAATADSALMDPNAMQSRTPISRTVPAEPDQGVPTPVSSDGQSQTSDYGYVGEDVIPYA